MLIKLTNDCQFNTSTSTLHFNNSEIIDEDLIRDFHITNKRNFINNTSKEINTINLIPTMQCDGCCEYCYNLEELNKNKHYMNFEDFEQGIDNIKKLNYSFDLDTLKLYGGEPLLNPNLADLIINIHKNYQFSTLYVSSGLLFSPQKFEYAISQLKKIVDYGIDFSIGVSVDFGLSPENFTRISNKTLINKNILLERCSIIEDIGIRVVYSTIVSNKTDIDLLKKDLLSLHESKKEHFDISDMDSKSDRKYAFRISVSNDDSLHPSMEMIQELYKFYKDAHENIALTSNLYPYTDVVYSPLIKKLDEDTFLFLYPSNYCGIFDDMITMLPNGDLTSCHMTPYTSNFEISEEQINYYFNNEKCDQCDFFNVCRGLCVNRNLQAPKAMDVYCEWAKLSFELALKRLYIINGNNIKKFQSYITSLSV